MTSPIFIDSDNALGSRRGDVDDAYAIAALIASGVEIAALSSCSGNTSEPLAFANNARLAELLGWRGSLLRAHEARERLRDFDGRIVALGPLTNIVDARRASEIIVVGGNSDTWGRFPPLWPHEFNLTHDRRAARAVFESGLPLTIFPLNIAKRLFVTREDLDALEGPLGEHLRNETRRWFAHLRRIRFTRRFPIYDLAAALYAIDPGGFAFESTTASTFFSFGRGTRPVKLCTGLDRDALWQRCLIYFRNYSQ